MHRNINIDKLIQKHYEEFAEVRAKYIENANPEQLTHFNVKNQALIEEVNHLTNDYPGKIDTLNTLNCYKNIIEKTLKEKDIPKNRPRCGM